MPKMKNGQITLSGVGEWYMDRLTIDAWINSRSVGFQASSLLCAKVQECESRIQERLAYLAKKRKISVEELEEQILKGTVTRLMPNEGISSTEDETESD